MKKTLLMAITLLITGIASGQVTNGLVARYSFNNGNANDEAGINNGTVNGATLTTDRFGNPNKAYSFSGNASIDCGNGNAIQTLIYRYSISAWFKRTSTSGGYEVIVAKWDNNPISEHIFLGTQNAHVAWATPGPGNGGTADTANFPLNAWNHVVLTWDSSGAHKIYLNNVLTTNIDLSSHTVNVTTPVNLLIGAQSAFYRNFNGSIDDIRIYNRVITPLEVDSLFKEANPGSVGINETVEQTITLYPNPSQGNITLSDNANVHITDVTGKLVFEMQDTNFIDLTTQPAGIYFITLTNAKGELMQRSKLIKE